MIDEVVITVKAGDGGDGSVSFRREKYVPKGGPDGGDGGGGGDVWFVCSPEVNTLFDFNRLKVLKTQNGQPGKKNRASGRDGEDLILKVPPGTIVSQILHERSVMKLADLVEPGQKLLLAKGGRGGWGNWHFATSTQQAPRFARPGEKGEQKTIKLELQMIAQVGLVGLPNVGKSSLLARISAAKPKIADYPFTTLEPILGVVDPRRFGIAGPAFVVADIPGLIEGASKGKGLGDQFLKHVERTKILVHILDATRDELASDHQTIINELTKFDPQLLKKPEIIVLNKTDLQPDCELTGAIKLSATTGRGIPQLIRKVVSSLRPSQGGCGD